MAMKRELKRNAEILSENDTKAGREFQSVIVPVRGIAEFPEFVYLRHQVGHPITPEFIPMLALHISLLVHLVGIGMIFTTLFGGFILEMKFRRAKDPATALLILKLVRPIGLLSPVSIVVMLVSGVANMHLTGLGLFSAGWLTLKLVVFALAAISGIVFGIKSSRRASIVGRLAGGETSEAIEGDLRALNRQQLMFYAVQTFLILSILSLSIVRPAI